jgi:hypothetical protein
MVSFTADLFDKSPSRWLSLAPFAVYFFIYPVHLLQIAIAINRFTAIWFPMRHTKVKILIFPVKNVNKCFLPTEKKMTLVPKVISRE